MGTNAPTDDRAVTPDLPEQGSETLPEQGSEALPGTDSLDERILAAAIRCAARWGIAKTSLDDVAREAGCSRASVYRAFPGGKEAVVAAAGRRELDRFVAGLGEELAACPDLESSLVRAMVGAATRVRDHEALQFLLAHEPGAVLPHLAFERLSPLFEAAEALLAPRFGVWLDREVAAVASELLARLVLSCVLSPSTRHDPCDEADARHLIATYILPGLVPGGPAHPIPPVPGHHS